MKVYMNKIFDKLGICASTLCLIHCLATPILILFFPAIEDLLGTSAEHFHTALAVIVVSLVLIAVYPQCRRHGHKDIVAIALIGVGFIIGSLFIENHPLAHHSTTIIGSIFLIIAHFKNMKVRHNKTEH